MDDPIRHKGSSRLTNDQLLQNLHTDVHALSSNFQEWKSSNREEKKGIYERLSTLEEKALYIPNSEESALIKEAAAFYRSKREFREKLYGALLEKGVTGLVLFTLAAVFFYLKHLLTES